MSTKIQHALLATIWPRLPQVVIGALYRRHRAIVAKKLASGKPYG